MAPSLSRRPPLHGRYPGAPRLPRPHYCPRRLRTRRPRRRGRAPASAARARPLRPSVLAHPLRRRAQHKPAGTGPAARPGPRLCACFSEPRLRQALALGCCPGQAVARVTGSTDLTCPVVGGPRAPPEHVVVRPCPCPLQRVPEPRQSPAASSHQTWVPTYLGLHCQVEGAFLEGQQVPIVIACALGVDPHFELPGERS